MPFDNLATASQASLLRFAADVVRVPKPEVERIEFQTDSLDPESEPQILTRRVDEWIRRGSSFIYYIEAAADATSLCHARTAFSEAKNHERGGRAYARLNEVSPNFYVGSSSSLGRRFREHLGYGGRATYALHLCKWAQELNLPLRFVAARYPVSVSGELLGLLEDQLWDTFRPMFGRKGRR